MTATDEEYDQLEARAHRAEKRIAEMEESLSREKADRKEAAESYPELRKELTCAYEQLDQERSRVEKAEVEVERLRQLIRTHGPCGPNCLLLIHMEEGGGREETPGGGCAPSRAEKAEAEVEWWHARDPEGWAFYKGRGGRESGASDRSGEGGSQLPGSTTAHVSAANPAAPRKERVP